MLPQGSSKVQKRLINLETYVDQHQMQVNVKKTKVQTFNFSRKYTFSSQLHFHQQQLDEVHETRLLGVTIRSDCRWSSHVTNIVTSACHKMWFLRRLKSFGASRETLTDVFKLFIRQSTELAAPLWSSAITRHDSDRLERIQRQATRLIIGPGSTADYSQRLKMLSLISMKQRLADLTRTFALKMGHDRRYAHLFPKRQSTNTRNKQTFIKPLCLTNRYLTSSLPVFVDILNQNPDT